MRKRAKEKAPVDRVLKSLVNVLSLVYATAVIPILLEWVDERSAVVGVSRREILLVPTGTVVGTAGGMAVGSAAIPTLRAASSLLHEPAYR
jgi:hypothetical protein